MKSTITALFVAFCVSAVPASATPTPPPKLSKWQQHQFENYKNSAPADEYFGRIKMSYLGMNNTFRDAGISSGAHTTDQGIINKVALAENALEAWAKKYPRDPQLARTYFLATQVDRKIWVKANQERAWVYLNRLVQTFPNTYFGKVLKRDLAIGFTEHYYAAAVPCSTSAADPNPSPGPTEVTLKKGLKVQIITPPCIPQPSPAAT